MGGLEHWCCARLFSCVKHENMKMQTTAAIFSRISVMLCLYMAAIAAMSQSESSGSSIVRWDERSVGGLQVIRRSVEDLVDLDDASRQRAGTHRILSKHRGSVSWGAAIPPA